MGPQMESEEGTVMGEAYRFPQAVGPQLGRAHLVDCAGAFFAASR